MEELLEERGVKEEAVRAVGTSPGGRPDDTSESWLREKKLVMFCCLLSGGAVGSKPLLGCLSGLGWAGSSLLEVL